MGHEYEPVTVESLARGVAAAHPGEIVVKVEDEYGTEVLALSQVHMTEEEREAVVSGDSCVTELGAHVERVRL